jgi:hypothetical protein
MPLLGQAAVAMWWSIVPEQRAEFGDWHTHEHMPERMGIPGFRRGSRWTSIETSDGFFVLYELATYETLTSQGYIDRLNAPTPWSSKMMPLHQGMVRSQCRVEASFGGGIGTSLATIRLSPVSNHEDALRSAVVDVLKAIASTPGLNSASFLMTDTPQTAVATTEQRIRGKDRTADWIILVSGYDVDTVRTVVDGPLSRDVLHRAGAEDAITTGLYALGFALAQQDLELPSS